MAARKNAQKCAFGWRSGELAMTPSNKIVRLAKLRLDGKWDAVYVASGDVVTIAGGLLAEPPERMLQFYGLA